MSLESAIKDLTDAVKANTAALAGAVPVAATKAVKATKVQAEPTKAVAPESGSTPQPESTTKAPEGGNPDAAVSYETVRASLGLVINKFGKAAGAAVFAQNGVTDPKVDLAGDDKAELRAKVNKAMLARAAASE